MCVIFCCEKAKPSAAEIDAAWDSNPYGGGLAWREDGKVRWIKDLGLEQMKEKAAALPLPYVLHFRIPSCGGSLPELTHPFPVTRNVEPIINGVTKGGVLFHNGHWNNWDRTLVDISAKSGKKLPKGKWSDSRAMAWIAAVIGYSYLELLGEKVIILTPDEVQLFGPINNQSGWRFYDERFWISNAYWTHKVKGADSSTKSSTFRPDEKRSLGVHDQVIDQDNYYMTAPHSMRGGKTGAKRGPSSVVPFSEVDQAYRTETPHPMLGRVSKNAWKRARKGWQKEQRQATKLMIKEAEAHLADMQKVH